MSEIVMTTEAEVEDFSDELSDEALDRPEGKGDFCNGCCGCGMGGSGGNGIRVGLLLQFSRQ